MRSSVGTEGVKPSIVPRRGSAVTSYNTNMPGPGAYSPNAPRGGTPAYRFDFSLLIFIELVQRLEAEWTRKLNTFQAQARIIL